jgi:hypothetical protein
MIVLEIFDIWNPKILHTWWKSVCSRLVFASDMMRGYSSHILRVPGTVLAQVHGSEPLGDIFLTLIPKLESKNCCEKSEKNIFRISISKQA